MTNVIDSIKDERIVSARRLTTRAGRRAEGRCLVEGASLIEQVLHTGLAVQYVLRSADAEVSPLSDALAQGSVPTHDVRPGLLRKVTGATKPVNWLAVVPCADELPEKAPYSGDFVVVCEDVVDPGNLGTLVRTASALGIQDVVLTDEHTDLTSRRTLDAARGAGLSARVRRFEGADQAISSLRGAGFQVVVTSPRGRHLQSLAPLRGDRVALVVGNETNGVSESTEAAADLVVQIPMAGAVESLNVGVAAGISIYELRMRMVLAMLTDRIRATLGRELNVSAQFARTAFDKQLRAVGDLDGAQVVTLMIVACERTTPNERLRRDLAVTADELDSLLAPLFANGYLVADTDDVCITDAGEQAVSALWTVQERVEEELLDGFTDEERTSFRDMLGRIRENAIRMSGDE